MYFKSSSFFLLIFAPTVTFFLGCAGESDLAKPPISVRLSQAGECLANIDKELSAYAKGERSDAEVIQFWDCAKSAIQDFKSITTGDGPDGSYRPRALVDFLKRYFFSELVLGDDSLVSYMKLKQVLVDGSEEWITTQDLDRLELFLETLKRVTLILNPSARVVFLTGEKASDQEIELAHERALRALNELSLWFEKSHHDYLFQDLNLLLKSMGLEQTFFPVVENTKKLVLGEPIDRVAVEEWRALFGVMGKAHYSAMNLVFAFSGDLNSGLVRVSLPRALNTLVDIFATAVENHKNHEISQTEFSQFFASLALTEVLPKAMTAKALDSAWSWFSNRLLLRQAPGKDTCFSSTHLKELRSRIQGWTELLKKAAKGKAKLPSEFSSILDRSAPMIWDSEGRIYFIEQGEWAKGDLPRMVWPYVVLDWIKDAYVGDSATDLSSDQMVFVASEVLDVLHEFGWMLSTSSSIGKKLLREADLFTNASNGDSRIQLFEAVRYLTFIASAYRSAELWLIDADKNCIDRDAGCVREVGSRYKLGILDSMPKLKSTFKQKSSLEFVRYILRAEETVHGQVIEGQYGTGDLLQTWMILQYIETFLQKYDLDMSQTISRSESVPGYHLFGPTLAQLLDQTGLPQEELEAFFTFLLKYGETPFTMFGGQIAWLNWKWHQDHWVFEADRDKLMGILYQLSKL